MNNKDTAAMLLSFIDQVHSPFHTLEASVAELVKHGFSEILSTDNWHLEAGKSYYLRCYGSTLIAFKIGDEPRKRIKVAAAHTDFPCLRIKPSSSVSSNQYGKINVEIYGGMILNTWLDRPLSIAGKVVLASDDPFHPHVKLVDFKRPLLTVPNLAIHMNRQINEGVELNKQKDMLPLATMLGKDVKDSEFFLELLAKEINCDKREILSYELTIYPTESGCLLGCKEEFISAPRLDNLTSVKACLAGLINSECTKGINIIALFDNEEVGSNTKQGAGSLVLTQAIERIYAARGYKRTDYLSDVAGGFLLSADVAHAMHPNVSEKNDITNKPVLNGGVTLKIAASQSYAGDAEAVGVVTAICQQNNIPYQIFVNRSDLKGGSTLGSILSTTLPMRTMDIGVPILAMHSARETMGIDDQAAIEKLLCKFFV